MKCFQSCFQNFCKFRKSLKVTRFCWTIQPHKCLLLLLLLPLSLQLISHVLLLMVVDGNQGPHSQPATCWRPDEEGTWSRSVWCPTAAAAAGGAWESWSGWRGGREERLFLVKLLRGGRDGTQMGCSGLAPSPKSRLRGALAQSLCAFSAASPSTPPSHPSFSGGGCAHGVLECWRPLFPFASVPACLTVFDIASLLVSLSSLDLAAEWSSQRQRGLRCLMASPDLPPARLSCCSRC